MVSLDHMQHTLFSIIAYKHISAHTVSFKAAEVNSLGWRTRGAAAATATNWIMAFVVVQITKVGLDNLGWAFYLSESYAS
jgi:hypothetical protein